MLIPADRIHIFLKSIDVLRDQKGSIGGDTSFCSEIFLIILTYNESPEKTMTDPTIKSFTKGKPL